MCDVQLPEIFLNMLVNMLWEGDFLSSMDWSGQKKRRGDVIAYVKDYKVRMAFEGGIIRDLEQLSASVMTT